MENLNAEFSINITANTYFRLLNLFWHILRRFPLGKKSTSMAEFFAGFKKGSKQCRKVLQKIDNSGFDTVMESFLNINNLNSIEKQIFSSSLGLWNLHCIPNGLREFIFKFYHNRLPLNHRISNYTDVSRWCTFCNIIGYGMGPFDNETFSHFFVSCPSVLAVHRRVDEDLLALDPDPGQGQARWTGLGNDNLFVRLFFLTVQYKIWECRLKKVVPNANYCIGEAIYTLDHACKVNKKLNDSLNSLLCPLSRLWTRLTRPRW
jgi:hypothetical protein